MCAQPDERRHRFPGAIENIWPTASTFAGLVNQFDEIGSLGHGVETELADLVGDSRRRGILPFDRLRKRRCAPAIPVLSAFQAEPTTDPALLTEGWRRMARPGACAAGRTPADTRSRPNAAAHASVFLEITQASASWAPDPPATGSVQV